MYLVHFWNGAEECRCSRCRERNFGNSRPERPYVDPILVEDPPGSQSCTFQVVDRDVVFWRCDGPHTCGCYNADGTKWEHPWTVRVDRERVCTGAQLSALCVAVRATPVGTPDLLWSQGIKIGCPRILSDCHVMPGVDGIDLKADTRIGIFRRERRETAMFRARELRAWLDRFTPLWRMTGQAAIDPAESQPKDEGV